MSGSVETLKARFLAAALLGMTLNLPSVARLRYNGYFPDFDGAVPTGQRAPA